MSELREFGAARPSPRPRRRCIFCDAPFTDRMEAWMGEDLPCPCCDGAVAGHWPAKFAAVPAPSQTQDLACDACGKVLYLAPQSPVPKA